jgi:KaiC/GvpD/RAD55 family RecA-like ATPase
MSRLFIEIFGEPAVGKTHLMSTFDGVLVIDTTPKREAEFVVKKVWGNEWEKHYAVAKNIAEVRKEVESALKREDVKAIVIDTSSNLQNMARDEWLSRNPKREAPLPFEYDEVRAPIEDIIRSVTEKKILGFTSIMKDEWIGDKFTGRRIRAGYKGTPFSADIILRLYVEDAGDKYVRKVKVLKNRFKDITSKEWIKELEVKEGMKIGDIVKILGGEL